MKKKTQEEIMEVIKAGLPQMVAGELAERLAQADQFEDEINSLEDVVETQSKNIKDLKERVNQELDLNNMKIDLESRIHDVDEKRRDLEFREEVLQLKEAHAADKVTLMKDNFDTVFKNRTVRTKALEMKAESLQRMDYVGNGAYPVTDIIHTPHEVVKEEEEL
ncbi:MAG: hypothetical protein V3U78_09930 [Thiotrichaceae bacterium]